MDKEKYKWKPGIVRRIRPDINPEQLTTDLRRLRQKAVEAGAADAAVVPVKDLVFSNDVLARVMVDSLFPSLHWPLAYPKDDLRDAIQVFEWAIFFRMATAAGFPDYGGGPIVGPRHRKRYFQLYELTARLESNCFYLGYYLAMGFGTGNCRSVFCADEKGCPPMLRGKTCRLPNRGRPSMEAAGIDAAAMAGQLEWNSDHDAGGPLLAGLILVA